MEQGKPVVVSNTATQPWELEPYLNLARQHGYTVQVVECHGNFGSVHGVPPEAVERMRARWVPTTEMGLRL